MLARILQAEGRGLTMIFCRTKRTAAKVADELADRGFAAAAIHGDLGQGAREQALRAFRNGKVDVLVATDVAARGIDVEDVTHVINYQCPEDEKTYLHRIGRTGRAGNTGVAVTFVDWDDLPRWGLINKDARPRHPRAAGDLLHLRPPLHRPRHPRRATGPRCPGAARPAPGLAAEEVEDLGETGKSSGRGTSGRGAGGRDSRGPAAEGGRSARRAHRAGPAPAARAAATATVRPPTRPVRRPRPRPRARPRRPRPTATAAPHAQPPRTRGGSTSGDAQS